MTTLCVCVCSRLVEVEQSVVQLSESLAEERTRREAAEEALGLAEDRAKR